MGVPRDQHDCILCGEQAYETLVNDRGEFVRHIRVEGRDEPPLTPDERAFLDAFLAEFEG